jgi:hypothetical protein
MVLYMLCAHRDSRWIEVMFNEVFCARPDVTFQGVADFLTEADCPSPASRQE